MMFGTLLSLALAVVAPATATPHQAEVERALYDLCPRVIAGTLKLDDPAQVAAIGYAPGALSEKRWNVTRGAGADQVVVSASKSPSTLCVVFFAAPDHDALYDAVLADARARGFAGPPPKAGGGITRIANVEQPTSVTDAKRLMLILLAGAEDIQFERAIMAVVSPNKDT